MLDYLFTSGYLFIRWASKAQAQTKARVTVAGTSHIYADYGRHWTVHLVSAWRLILEFPKWIIAVFVEVDGYRTALVLVWPPSLSLDSISFYSRPGL